MHGRPYAKAGPSILPTSECLPRTHSPVCQFNTGMERAAALQSTPALRGVDYRPHLLDVMQPGYALRLRRQRSGRARSTLRTGPSLPGCGTQHTFLHRAAVQRQVDDFINDSVDVRAMRKLYTTEFLQLFNMGCAVCSCLRACMFALVHVNIVEALGTPMPKHVLSNEV